MSVRKRAAAGGCAAAHRVPRLVVADGADGQRGVAVAGVVVRHVELLVRDVRRGGLEAERAHRVAAAARAEERGIGGRGERGGGGGGGGRGRELATVGEDERGAGGEHGAGRVQQLEATACRGEHGAKCRLDAGEGAVRRRREVRKTGLPCDHRRRQLRGRTVEGYGDAEGGGGSYGQLHLCAAALYDDAMLRRRLQAQRPGSDDQRQGYHRRRVVNARKLSNVSY